MANETKIGPSISVIFCPSLEEVVDGSVKFPLPVVGGVVLREIGPGVELRELTEGLGGKVWKVGLFSMPPDQHIQHLAAVAAREWCAQRAEEEAEDYGPDEHRTRGALLGCAAIFRAGPPASVTPEEPKEPVDPIPEHGRMLDLPFHYQGEEYHLWLDVDGAFGGMVHIANEEYGAAVVRPGGGSDVYVSGAKWDAGEQEIRWEESDLVGAVGPEGVDAPENTPEETARRIELIKAAELALRDMVGAVTRGA